MIEKPQPKDVLAIEQVAREAGNFTPTEVSTVREMLETFLHPEPRDDHTFIVYRNGNADSVVGFACYGPTPLAERVWDLYWICVDRVHQKNGIGRVLLSNIENEVCRCGGRAIYLETSDSPIYQPAREFYERNGYRRVAEIDDFYALGEGKIIYRKTFKPS